MVVVERARAVVEDTTNLKGDCISLRASIEIGRLLRPCLPWCDKRGGELWNVRILHQEIACPFKRVYGSASM